MNPEEMSDAELLAALGVSQQTPQPQQAQQAQQPPYSGPMPSDVRSVMPALIQQESSGRPGVLGPQTRYGRAEGLTQMLPATARQMAGKLGVPWRPELMRGDTPEAAQYQAQLGEAYLQEGLEKTGNMRDALRYYHGGPDRRQWGPKTNRYADEVLGRLGSAQPMQTTLSEPADDMANLSDDQLLAMIKQDAPQSESVQQIATIPQWESLTREQQMALGKGDQVRLPGGEVVTLRGSPFVDGEVRPGDRRVGGLNLREPNLQDQAGAYAQAFSEQIPFGDEAIAAAVGLATGRGYSAARDQQAVNRELGNQTERGARQAGGVSGFATGFVLPGAGYVGRGANIAQRATRAAQVGAGYGGLYGAGAQDGGLSERLGGAARGAAIGGATAGILQPGAERLMAGAGRAAQNVSPARRLSRQGVELTPGQMLESTPVLGRTLRGVEDAAAGLPFLGAPVAQARNRSIESMNRVAINNALEPIGERVRAIGRQGYAQADTAVSNAFREALEGVAVPRTPEFDAAVTGLARQNPLPGELQGQYLGLINDMLRRFGQGIDGQGWKQIDSELAAATTSAYAGAQNNPASRLLGQRLADTRAAWTQALEAASPEAAEKIAAANEAFARLSRIQTASAALGAARNDGIFTAGQLSSAVRSGDRGSRGRRFARGEALLQELSDDANAVLPSTVNDSGTTSRAMVATAAAGTAAGMVAPQLAVPIVATSVAYAGPAQKAINAIYRKFDNPGAMSRGLSELAQLARRNPALVPYYEDALRRVQLLSPQRERQAGRGRGSQGWSTLPQMGY